MTRKILIIAAILTLTFPLIVRAAEKAPGVTAAEIKIGATYPFSGPASAYATTGKGLIAYIDYLNDKGGINGRKINFIALDDAYGLDKTPLRIAQNEPIHSTQGFLLKGSLKLRSR